MSAALPASGRVPFLDLEAGRLELAEPIAEATARVVESGRYLLGPELERFEHDFAAFAGARFCVGVGSGLDALRLVLTAWGVGPGDEVIVPGQTFIATWLAVSALGAEPVPIDVDPATHLMEPGLVEAAVGPRTKAIVPVDLYGHPAAHRSFRDIADRHGLRLLDDAAQAHGARLDGLPVGTFTDAAAWSFYPGKNLGAVGDGGAVTTDDEELADRLRRLRNYGSAEKYVHLEQGLNSRLDELQAAVLRAKLARLEEWNARRKDVASTYRQALRASPVELPVVLPGAAPSWHLFVVRSERRDELAAHLDARGIGTGIHYPTPPHRQPAYRHAPAAGASLPASDAAARTSLSLPIGPHLRPEDVARVVDAVLAFDA